MLFLLSCLCGNDSNASSERPSNTPRSPDTSITPPSGHLPQAKGVTIGQTGAASHLNDDRQQTAQDLGEYSVSESRFMDVSVVILAEADPSEGDSPPVSQAQAQKKAVAFNRLVSVREFVGMRREGGLSVSGHQAVPDGVTLGRDSIEAGAGTCRKFIASAKHWVDTFEAEKNSASALKGAGPRPLSQQISPGAHKSNAPEIGVEGLQSLQALLDLIEESNPVITARQIFAQARSAESERDSTADSLQLPALEFLSEDLFELVEAMFDLTEALDYLRVEGTRHPHQKVVERLANRVLTNEGIGALDGVDVPELPQRPIWPISIVDDPKRGNAEVQDQGWVSFAGDETTISHSLVPVLIWGEFLAGLDYVAQQIAEGAARLEEPEDTWVRVLRD